MAPQKWVLFIFEENIPISKIGIFSYLGATTIRHIINNMEIIACKEEKKDGIFNYIDTTFLIHKPSIC